ncbi:MAG: lysophospholipid acyltransferase family protein [Deltaproteobacteria bacterium]|nr:lysophospholipid acyltransferase family protein [Deltaproteobacteria bacterium]
MPVPLRKRLRRALRALFLRLLVALLGLLPVGLALRAGRFLGRWVHRLAHRSRELTLTHLGQAFPQLSEAEREALSRACFESLGEHLLEDLVVRRVERRLNTWVTLDPESQEILERAYGSGRGVVLCTGHLGNWELAARALCRRGFPVTALARRSHDAGIAALLERFRREGGVELIYRGEPANARKILATLRRGSALFVLVDQDLDERSVYVPFFGRDARSVRGPADLALRSGAHLLVGWIHREAPGEGHRISIRELAVEPTGDREADVLRLTAEIQATLEEAIRAAPEQWVWFHRRWYRRPGEESTVGD